MIEDTQGVSCEGMSDLHVRSDLELTIWYFAEEIDKSLFSPMWSEQVHSARYQYEQLSLLYFMKKYWLTSVINVGLVFN